MNMRHLATENIRGTKCHCRNIKKQTLPLPQELNRDTHITCETMVPRTVIDFIEYIALIVLHIQNPTLTNGTNKPGNMKMNLPYYLNK